LNQDHSKIAGKNPHDDPDVFGLALYPPDWQQIRGSLSNVSAAADGTVWGANKAGELYRYVRHDDGSYHWEEPKARNHVIDISVVAVGSAKNIWVVDKQGQACKYGGESVVWQDVPSNLSWISAAADGTVWGVARVPSGNVCRYVGGRDIWEYLPGTFNLTIVAVGSAKNIWGLDKDGKIYRYVGGSKWDPVPGSLSNISVAADETVWGVNKDGYIYKYVGTPAQNPWQRMTGRLGTVSVGSATNIWGVNSLGGVFRFPK
jgi:hypothetical protein